MKVNISPKSPRIELSNDKFAERKCCEVIAYESETFHRRRRNGISHCKNGEQTPNLPFPLDDVDPHLIQQCRCPPHAPPQTAATTVEALSHTYAVKSPLVTMASPNFVPKSVLFRGPNPIPHYLPHLWTRPTYGAIRHPDPTLRFPQCAGQTDRLTDRSSTGNFDDYSPLYASNESDAA